MSSTTRLVLALLSITTIFALPTPEPSTSNCNSVPLNGLPAPSNQVLKHIGLGMGVQNYTCSAPGATPLAIGAVASLYDATFLSTPSRSSQISSFAALAYSTSSWFDLPTLGHHYFDAAGVPTFDLGGKGYLIAKKVAGVKAPGNAVKGSVDWLLLNDKGGSWGVETVYRVETAGGSAPASCVKAGVLEVKYAAEYWFYG